MTSLSIVVPFYGVEAYIGECLESLRAQTFTDFEVIMVDDGSPDRSRDIAERYAETDSRFKLVVQENQGLGPARNTGTAHASGKYIAFVDSDDVVAPRAYSLLVDTLERTGSSFAAGNARRFSSAEGTRQSWTHREAFAQTRLATSIREFPVLMMDRMVWNKVYRRSFWDAGGYEFPPIRYEDYPVTLQAHLDAAAVDVHSAHVYYWRDRESGDSITQQVFKPANARDRVTSAHMVLDLLKDSVPQEVSERVRAIFIDVDLVALAGALAQAPAENQPALERLALGLAERLPLQPVGRVTRFARVIHEGLLRGDLGFVRAVSTWRQARNPAPLAAHLARHPRTAALVARTLRSVELPDPFAPRRLRAHLVGSETVGDALVLTTKVALRAALASRARCQVYLRTRGRRVRLTASRSAVRDGLELQVSLTPTELREMNGLPCTVEIELSLAAVRWRGRVRVPLGLVPPLWTPGSGTRVQGTTHGEWQHLWFHPVPSASVVVTGVAGSETELTLELDRTGGELVITLPHPSPAIVVPVTGTGHAVVPMAQLLADPLDDPVTKVQARQLTYLAGHTSSPEAVYVSAAGSPLSAGGEVVLVGPMLDGHASVIRRPSAEPEARDG